MASTKISIKSEYSTEFTDSDRINRMKMDSQKPGSRIIIRAKARTIVNIEGPDPSGVDKQ